MISIPYFKYTFKSNFKFLFAFTFVLCLFLVVMTSVFTPETVTGLEHSTKGTAASHILTGNGTLVSFMGNSFFALMAILYPMIYSIIIANRLIAEKVDKRTMIGFLSTPVSRIQISVSSALYLVLSLIIMWTAVYITGILAANAFQPDALDKDKFLTLNIGALLYHLLIGSISFCASCIFNTSKGSLILGAELPLCFFVISLMVKLSDSLDFLKYYTVNTLFDTKNIISGSGYSGEFAAMIVSAVIIYSAGIIWFQKKDLSI